MADKITMSSDGVLSVSDEVTSEGGAGNIRIGGTVDLFHSAIAIDTASQRMSTTTVLAWREVGSPSP